MAISLGKDGGAPPFGVDVISATLTKEVDAVDVSNRDNIDGTSGNPGYRKYQAGLEAHTWEIECHDPTALIAALETNSPTSGFIVMSVTENVSIDGAVTYTVTAREA